MIFLSLKFKSCVLLSYAQPLNLNPIGNSPLFFSTLKLIIVLKTGKVYLYNNSLCFVKG